MLSDSPNLPRRTAPIVLGIILAFTGATQAQPPLVPAVSGDGLKVKSTLSASRIVDGQDTLPKDATPLPKLNVADCLRIAMEKQPKLAAMRASLGSAQVGQRAIDGAKFFGVFAGDIKLRRQQACNGVLAAQAELDQSIHEVNQAVIWTYYSVVYARAQLKVAKEAVDFVDFYRDQVETIVKGKKGGSREINQITLNTLIARLAEGQLLLIEAQSGAERAQAALREAMGIEHTFRFDVADEILPDFGKFEIQKDVVIAHAQTRRGEVLMASLAADVTRLEALIQWAHKFRFRVETFAGAADIHSRPLPPGSKDGEYRPDVIGPEMPKTLIGDKYARSQRAWFLATRSEAVLEKTRNLVTLEAHNAFFEYYYAGFSMETAKKMSEASNSNLKLLKEVAGDRVDKSSTLQQLLEAQDLAAKGQAAHNKAVYQRIAALANIERITAGGIKVNFPGR